MQSLALISAAAIVAIWIIYPVVIALLARIVGQRIAEGMEFLPGVSIIIATRESPGVVRQRVQNCFEAYEDTRTEVIVAVDATVPDFDPVEYGGGDSRVRVVRGDMPGGKVCALNAGVRVASGEILVFTDTYQRFAPNTIHALVGAFADSNVGAASGRLELPTQTAKATLAGWYWTLERWLRRNEARVHSSVGVTGAIYAMRRPLWIPLPAGLLLDDLYTPMRLVLDGHRVAFVDDARAIETRVHSAEQEYHRKVRTLTGVMQLCAWLPEVLMPVRNPIWPQFVCHKLLRLLTPYLLVGMSVGVAGITAHWLLEVVSPLGQATVAMLVLGGVVAFPTLLWRVRRVAHQMLLIQMAILIATANGFRGRWQVWR